MKAPLKWLADYVDLPESLDQLVHKLVMSGTEVENISRPSQDWNDVVIAEVLSLDRPPESKHLSVAGLAVGTESIIAVTGAPNIEVGQKVPIVRIGGVVPRGPEGKAVHLQPRTMMGITGDAMVLSERELGLSEEHSGIMVLPGDAPVGRHLAEIMGDTVLDVEVKGRSDELCLLGIAREIAATTGLDLREPDGSLPSSVRTEGSPNINVDVVDADLCPRYTVLRIDGIRVADSPAWLTRRLESAGVRSINNVVDVTNFVMLELGQPLHAFDRATVPPDGKIIVRRSQPGETIMTLDGVERTLASDTLLITDSTAPTGIAGIMGGGRSEVTESTTSILVEAANFDRVNIRRSSRQLGLRTEASTRFERGVPPELTSIAIARCVNLFASVVQDEITIYDLVDVRADTTEMPTIAFRSEDIERLLGVQLASERARDSLIRLGFQTRLEGDSLSVVPPYWRRDVEGVADVAEEIARMIGYDAIPETLPLQQIPPVPLPPDMRWENVVRETLWGIGLSEAWTDTLTSAEALARLFPAGTKGELDWSRVVANPEGLALHQATANVMGLVNAPTHERSALRLSLVPSLLDVVSTNLKHTRERVAFFEIARTFFPRGDDLPYERRTVAIVIAGDREQRSWNLTGRQYGFFDLKGIVVATLDGFHAWRLDSSEELEAGTDRRSAHSVIQFTRPRPSDLNPSLHPGRQAHLWVSGHQVGSLGEVHPSVADQFQIEPPVRAYAAELDLDALTARARPGGLSRPISRFPAVKRDISLAFPIDVEAAMIERLVTAHGGELLHEARIVDVYQDAALGAERKSIALALTFQSDSSTLTQEQVSAVQDAIVANLERELGAELRG